MKELIFITALLIQGQDSNNFKERDYCTKSLEYVSHVFDVRPQLDQTLSDRKSSLELRRRCKEVYDYTTEVRLQEMRRTKVPNMPKHTKYYIAGQVEMLYDNAWDASAALTEQTICECGFTGITKYNSSKIRQKHITISVDEFITEEYAKDPLLSDKEILKQLEDRIKNATKESRRSPTGASRFTPARRPEDIPFDFRRTYTNLLPSRARPIYKE